MSDRTAIHTGVESTDHPVEQTDASGKSRCKAEEQATVRVGEPALRSEEQPSRAKDEKHLVLKRILAAHEQWFDVRRGYEYAGRTFPGYGGMLVECLLAATLTSLGITFYQKTLLIMKGGDIFAPAVQALLAVLLFVLAVVLAVKGVKTIVATAKRNAA